MGLFYSSLHNISVGMSFLYLHLLLDFPPHVGYKTLLMKCFRKDGTICLFLMRHSVFQGCLSFLRCGNMLRWVGAAYVCVRVRVTEV